MAAVANLGKPWPCGSMQGYNDVMLLQSHNLGYLGHPNSAGASRAVAMVLCV